MCLNINAGTLKRGGPGVGQVLKAACLPAYEIGARYGIHISNKLVFILRSLEKIQYCVEPPWHKVSMLGSDHQDVLESPENSGL